MKNTLFVCKRLVELKFSLRLNADEFSYLTYLIDDLLPVCNIDSYVFQINLT